MADEKIYPEGLYLEKKGSKDGKFSFVKQSYNVEKFIAFLTKHKNERGYVEIVQYETRDGKPYGVLDTWKPTTQPESSTNSDLPL